MASPPKRHDLKALGKLSEDDAGGFFQQAEVVQGAPEWFRLQKSGILPAGAAQALITFHTLSPTEKSAKFASDPEVVRALMASLKDVTDAHSINYTLTTLFDILRDDTSKADPLVRALRDEAVFPAFCTLLEKQNETHVADKAAFVLSSMISRAFEEQFTNDQVTHFIANLVQGAYKLSNMGRLVALCNVLKKGSLRKTCWATSGFSELLKGNLSPKVSSGELYYACFCVWLLTFHEAFIPQVVDAGLLAIICTLLKECKREKVIRLVTRVLVTCLKRDEAIEICIEENVVQVLTLLEYEKWRDSDTYTEIQEGIAAMQHKIKLLSNYDRYKREVLTGNLNWSFLHSEKFWLENVMQFEDNEFEVIKRLVDLLKTSGSSPMTLQVACYDLGEFARLHPTGKRILQRLQAKPFVMVLMQHPDGNVCREALLCTQKLMLDRWRAAAGAS